MKELKEKSVKWVEEDCKTKRALYKMLIAKSRIEYINPSNPTNSLEPVKPLAHTSKQLDWECAPSSPT